MGKKLITIVVLAVVVGFGYPAHAIHETLVEGTRIAEPGSDAAKLYDYITKSKPDYHSWNLWPGKEKLTSSKEPHGSFATVYVNNVASKALKKTNTLPYGSIIVQEEYSADRELKGLTVMYKIQGYNAEAGDWFWVKYDSPNGYVVSSGKIDTCISCHSQWKETDYLKTQ